VPWRAAAPIIAITDLCFAAGIQVYVLGDDYHLRGCQDHVPWAEDGTGPKLLGRVYACDVMYQESPYTALKAWVLNTLRSDIDTTWIDYVNIAGRQYGFDGTDRGTSPDQHWHTSVKRGYENVTPTAFLASLGRFLGIGVDPEPLPTPTPGTGFLMALTDKQQGDIAWTLGVVDGGPGPLHARLTTLENGITHLTEDVHALALALNTLAARLLP
jgi:hypothetical protein